MRRLGRFHRLLNSKSVPDRPKKADRNQQSWLSEFHYKSVGLAANLSIKNLPAVIVIRIAQNIAITVQHESRCLDFGQDDVRIDTVQCAAGLSR